MPELFEKVFGAVILLIVAVLVLASLLYGPHLWQIKVLIGGILIAISICLLWVAWRERNKQGGGKGE